MHQDMNYQLVRVCHISKLRNAGLRPTRQRIALAQLLFANGGRHVTAEALHGEALQANVPVSLATIYNTLNQFTDAGLLREVAIEGHKSYFDTNTHDHPHFYWEDEHRLSDAPADQLEIIQLPDAPDGTEIAKVDVVIRLRRK